MPAKRPRISSGIVWFQINPRNIPLITSAPPAIANSRRIHHSPGANAIRPTADPQQAAAMTIARP